MTNTTVTNGNGHGRARTFRGRTLEEALTQVREQIGGEALVLRRREGLMGGVGGFFARPFVEVEAIAPPRVDTHDGAAIDPPLHSAAVPDALGEPHGPPRPPAADPATDSDTASFAELLDDLNATFEDLPSPATDPPLEWADRPPAGELAGPYAWEQAAPPEPPEPLPEPTSLAPPEPLPAPTPRPEPAGPTPLFTEPTLLPAPTLPQPVDATPPALGGEAAEIVGELVAAGIEQPLAGAVVAEAVSHRAPFAPRTGLRKLVRRALAGRIPTAHSAPEGPRVVAFTGAGGAGKTTCVELLASAYAARSDLAVVCVAFETAGDDLARRLKPHGVPVIEASGTAEARAAIARLRDHALVVIDTPAPPPGDPGGVRALATRLKKIGAVEVQLALPVTLSARAAEDLVERFDAFKPRRLALTHAEDVAHAGPALALAIRHGTPLSYLVEPAGSRSALALADPERLAAGVLR